MTEVCELEKKGAEKSTKLSNISQWNGAPAAVLWNVTFLDNPAKHALGTNYM